MTATEPKLYRNSFFWTGIAFALTGYGLENFFDSSMAFEFLLLFGGMYIGIAAERTRLAKSTAA